MDGGLLTIGAFARAARLSPKALRLYDELGLLTPAHVDPHSGYRRYAPAQLERARLVAWLRRLGMPLARIREVCELAPGPAARAVAAYWAQVEAEVAARRDLAAFLVDQLARKDPAMTEQHPQPTQPLTLRCAALTDQGLVRTVHQDAAYAGRRLLAVADGFGPGGGPAATAAIEALKALEDRDLTGLPAADLPGVLAAAALPAHRAAHGADGPEGAAAGTGGGAAGAGDRAMTGSTLTALLHSGSRLALLHLGDSRAYVLRDSGLFRITHDHSVVQSLIDEGRLTPEEAPSHPQRSLLLRALGGGTDFAPDLDVLDARPQERYLLCTDGLTGVVPPEAIRAALTGAATPQQAVTDLVRLTREAGAPDNVGCVVADLVGEGAGVQGPWGP
ncbi:MerR family transcriptional regulator [Streptomyces sp. RS10V-4]|uniref:MerR family transcriptional regulator n=1 Tax=Streptomyces rhizoryzae TaxID=2932493 RepID=UPI002004DB85|nr:MerR family transcriptional regulator [Streptomyces rhizoryzae]MCK7624912.1 MerR family transcriptional regulator [Streptomyces rhizoryzae]